MSTRVTGFVAVLLSGWRETSFVNRLQLGAGAGIAGAVLAAFVAGAVTGGRVTSAAGLSSPKPLAGAKPPLPVAAHGLGKLTPAVTPGRPPLPGTGPRGLSSTGAPTGPGGPGSPGSPVKAPSKPGAGDAGQPGGGTTASTPLAIGLAYPTRGTAGAVSAALGLREQPGDTAAQAQAVTAWINRQGGVAGRRLTVASVPYDQAGAGSFGAAFEPACETLGASLLRPVAVIAPLEDAAAQSGCLARVGLTLVGDAPAPGDRQTFADAGGTLFSPASMSLDRLAAGEVRSLLNTGFLSRGDRVGIVRIDAAPFARVAQHTLAPALSRAGINVVLDTAIRHPQVAGDVPLVLAQAGGAALRLRGAGVDRVIVLDAGGLITPAMMRVADALGYQPRWALNSTMAPAALPASVPRRQLQGARGVGFAPLLDVAEQGEPQPPGTRVACADIYHAAGVALGGRTPAGTYSAIALCDQMMLVRDALGAGTSPDAFRAALIRVSATRASATALTARLEPARHDGANSLAPLAYNQRCDCVQYTAPPEPIP